MNRRTFAKNLGTLIGTSSLLPIMSFAKNDDFKTIWVNNEDVSIVKNPITKQTQYFAPLEFIDKNNPNCCVLELFKDKTTSKKRLFNNLKLINKNNQRFPDQPTAKSFKYKYEIRSHITKNGETINLFGHEALQCKIKARSNHNAQVFISVHNPTINCKNQSNWQTYQKVKQ